MTVFGKKETGKSEQAIGKAKIGVANKGRTQFGGKLSNKARLDLAKSGTKDLVSGLRKVNQAKRKEAKGQKPYLST